MLQGWCHGVDAGDHGTRHRRGARVAVALALALTTASSAALDPARPLSELRLTNWSRQDGLPHELVLDVLQSPDGYIWVATWLGAARFNGSDFQIYDRRRMPWLRDDAVTDLTLDPQGALLLLSPRQGLSRVDGDSVAALPHALNSAGITVSNTGDALWLGTDDGLLKFEAGGARSYGAAEGLPDPAALWIEPAPDGVVWVGTPRGVARVDRNGVQTFDARHGLPEGEVGTVLVQRDGTVRVGGKDGAYRLQGSAFVREPASLPTDEVTALLLDREGALWIGTAGTGLFRDGPRGLEQLAPGDGLPNQHVNALVQDAHGNVWVGTHGGLTMLSASRFSNYSRANGLADNFVRAVAEDAQGRFWVATNGGVSRLSERRVEAGWRDEPRAQLPALSLLLRRNGEVWIGSYSHGVSIVEGERWRSLGRSDGLAGEEVRAMLEANDGSLWIGTSTGLTQLREGAARSWGQNDQEGASIYVRTLMEDSAGRIWVGMLPGAAYIEDGELHRLPTQALDGASIFGLHECEHGAVWLVGQGGIRRWRNGALTTLDAVHGLQDQTPFAMLDDGAGTDWLTSSRGLLAIEHAALERAMDGDLTPLPKRWIGTAGSGDSISSNGGSWPSVARARDGRLLLATAQGLAVYDPSVPEPTPQAAPAVIESVIADGVAMAANDRELAGGTRRIEFHFAGLSYVGREFLTYRYRLDGYDSEWIAAGRNTSASYTNLSPGHYNFHVQALTPGAADAARTAQRSFVLQPQLHQQPLFQASALLLGTVLVWALHRRRLRGLRRRTTELQAEVAARTHDLQQRGLVLEQADRDKAELIARLETQAALLARSAQEDGLTGLANRRHLDAELTRRLEAAHAGSAPPLVALIDLDHFKAVNDRFGHAAGDEVLRRLGALVRVRCSERMLGGRYGGEEFAVVFEGEDVAGAAAWCEALRLAAAALRFEDAGFALELGLSIGIGDPNPADLRDCYASADRRLYVAKQRGRGRVVADDAAAEVSQAT